MSNWLQNKLSSHNGFTRKGAAAALEVPKWWKCLRARPDDYLAAPPMLANSFPKSGTHLVFQIVDGLPNSTNYGAFLASMTSSFRFRERSPDDATRFIARFAPGEIVRGHLFFHPQNAADLAAKNVVHYFAYRDPRDVVVSEAHYLREMNRWHRLAPRFRELPSIDEAIMLSITGFDPPVPGIEYPNIAARFARYSGWLDRDDCLAIRFEDLASQRRSAVIRRMAEFYAARSRAQHDIDACVATMTASIAPHKSHTFRSGKKAGWQSEFTAEHRRVFDQLAGELLIQLEYESNHDWANVAGTLCVP
jgi:sulfotransferase 6B1